MLPLLLLSAALIAPSSLRSRRFATSRTPALRADAAWLEPPPVGAWPEALCGPWEVRSSLSNAAETWVELAATARCSARRRVGERRGWSGVRAPTARGLSRRCSTSPPAAVFEGAVRTDSEYHAFSWSGT